MLTAAPDFRASVTVTTANIPDGDICGAITIPTCLTVGLAPIVFTGKVVIDYDGDGVSDGDAGCGYPITLTRGSTVVAGPTNSDGNGDYSFSAVTEPGTFYTGITTSGLWSVYTGAANDLTLGTTDSSAPITPTATTPNAFEDFRVTRTFTVTTNVRYDLADAGSRDAAAVCAAANPSRPSTSLYTISSPFTGPVSDVYTASNQNIGGAGGSGSSGQRGKA